MLLTLFITAAGLGGSCRPDEPAMSAVTGLESAVFSDVIGVGGTAPPGVLCTEDTLALQAEKDELPVESLLVFADQTMGVREAATRSRILKLISVNRTRTVMS